MEKTGISSVSLSAAGDHPAELSGRNNQGKTRHRLITRATCPGRAPDGAAVLYCDVLVYAVSCKQLKDNIVCNFYKWLNSNMNFILYSCYRQEYKFTVDSNL